MIFLDAASTTRPYKEVIETISDIAYNNWYNPSASYSVGHNAMILIEDVRKQFADDLNCEPGEIIFTSSACEANTQAILGVLERHPHMHFYTTRLEHTSISEICKNISGHPIGWIPNDKYGYIKLDDLENILGWNYVRRIKTLVSISFANSELGVIQNIKSISELIHRFGGILHVDAVQAFPWMKIDVQDLGIDLMTISGQKFHGGRGCAVLYVKEGIKIKPIIHGSQENSLRGGTYNTPAICGMSKALELTREHNATTYVKKLRDKLEDELLKIKGMHVNGPSRQSLLKLPNVISLTIDGVNAEKLVTMCDLMGIIIGRGSACKSYEPTPSEALLAIGLTEEQALNTIRISLDEFNTEEEIKQAADIITKLVERIRNTNE